MILRVVSTLYDNNIISSTKRLNIINKIFKLAATWKNQFSFDNTSIRQQDESRKLAWATFLLFNSLNKTEHKLISSASAVYKNPPTFQQILTIYQYIAHNTIINDDP